MPELLRSPFASSAVTASQRLKAKLTLEIEDRLIQEYVVQLLDNGIRSGFANIAPVPLDPKKR